MINKEEAQVIKNELSIIIDYVKFVLGLNVEKQDEDVYEIDGRQFLAIEKSLQYILELEEENKKQTKLNEEHQKLNGELQEKLTKAEEIIEGKAIQEMGMSDLYKED